MTPTHPSPNARRKVICAWGVHLYTSLGLVAGFLALLAVFDGNLRASWVFLGLALFIDATDGGLARKADVKRWTPHFDGRKLDDIVDYLNYTFIPVVFAYRYGLVIGVAGQLVLGAGPDPLGLRLLPDGRQDRRRLLHRLPEFLEYHHPVPLSFPTAAGRSMR